MLHLVLHIFPLSIEVPHYLIVHCMKLVDQYNGIAELKQDFVDMFLRHLENESRQNSIRMVTYYLKNGAILKQSANVSGRNFLVGRKVSPFLPFFKLVQQKPEKLANKNPCL